MNETIKESEHHILKKTVSCKSWLLRGLIGVLYLELHPSYYLVCRRYSNFIACWMCSCGHFVMVLYFFSLSQAKIAFLNGERKGQENLKNDLVRRIKMLEYALKQERWGCNCLYLHMNGNMMLCSPLYSKQLSEVFELAVLFLCTRHGLSKLYYNIKKNSFQNTIP